jgi:hypothetical protein
VELYLQSGHNMMSLCRELISKWGGGTVILSPRDLEEDRLCRFADEIIGRGGKTLLDPQLYNPRASHPRLTDHAYWPNDYSTDWSCPPSVDTRSLGTMPMRRCSHAPYQAGLSA